METELKIVLKVAILMLFFAWIVKGSDEVEANCIDEVSDCDTYDQHNICDSDRLFAFVYCRKHCGLCKECVIPSIPPKNANLTLSWDGSHIILNYRCHAGHSLINGSLTRTCNNSKWSGSIPKCLPDCGHLSTLGLSNIEYRLLQNDTKYPSTANISCQIGYTDVNQNQTEGISTTEVICSENGTWENLPTCVKKDCGDVQNVRIEHAAYRTLLNGDTKYNDAAEVTCDLGYYDIDQNQTTGVSKRTLLCSYTGTWTNIPKCIPKDCHDIKVITIAHAAQRRYNGTKFNSTAEIDCNDGYYDQRENQTHATSTTVIRCSEHGTWTNIPSCIRKDCGSLEMLNISNAANRLFFTDTKYGSSAAVTCKTGYYDNNKAQMKGVSSTLIKCSKNGTWVTVPKCVRKDCGNLTDITITNAVHRRLHTDTKFKSIADIDCDDGYYIKGRIQAAGTSTQTITCSDTGTWINVPECVPKDCGRLDQLSLSNAKDRSLINGTTIYTSLANISCDEGYKELISSQVLGITSTVVRCNGNGTWENLPKCVRKDCGDVQNVRMERAANRTLLNGDTKYNDTAEVTCDLGYYVTDQYQTTGVSKRTILCSYTGQWTNIPKCIPK
ncbi:sushi, von Willebrand factor type A, EGF and pentraxin domain-containing protein 1-like, partial [Ruditapes philippinarum]|uniref:sushi, von Willebrand factor type A, EGF and pentraxin domain-containing protein 1-like n=1 Tax=Ruditapes philippinarum TaxID=129788 RepID=UPI00295BB353